MDSECWTHVATAVVAVATPLLACIRFLALKLLDALEENAARERENRERFEDLFLDAHHASPPD